MKLSIVTINYNNADGLRKTLASVAMQTYHDIEHIIVDATSTDGSVGIIKEYADRSKHTVVWTSEKDKGIYDGMNKGIEIALSKRVVDAFNRSELREDKNKVLSDYVYMLNSGDALAAPNVVEKMMSILKDGNIDILLGNIGRVYENKKEYAPLPVKREKDEAPRPMDVSMLTFYTGTVPQDAAFVKRELYEKYGYFDETMKICADWKLYLNMTALGGVQPMYVNIDVVLFEMTGVSNTDNERLKAEKRAYLEEILPASVLKDYDNHAFDIEQMNRLRNRHLYWFVYFIERVLFKLEKWKVLR